MSVVCSLHLYPPKVKDEQKVIPRRILAEAEFTVKGMVSEWKIEAQTIIPIFWTIPMPPLV